MWNCHYKIWNKMVFTITSEITNSPKITFLWFFNKNCLTGSNKAAVSGDSKYFKSGPPSFFLTAILFFHQAYIACWIKRNWAWPVTWLAWNFGAQTLIKTERFSRLFSCLHPVLGPFRWKLIETFEKNKAWISEKHFLVLWRKKIPKNF